MVAKNNTHRLVITREFDAPRELVWKAWTTPAHVSQWLQLKDGNTVESVKMDLRVGGKFRIQTRMADGEYFTAAGTYLEVKPPERLVYTWDWEKDGSEADFGELEGAQTELTIEFREIGRRTEMILTHVGLATAEKRDNHLAGWGKWLDRMQAFIKTEQRNGGQP